MRVLFIHSKSGRTKEQSLKNVAIANALQLEAARRHTPVLSRFNYDATPNLNAIEQSAAELL